MHKALCQMLGFNAEADCTACPGRAHAVGRGEHSGKRIAICGQGFAGANKGLRRNCMGAETVEGPSERATTVQRLER